MNIKICAVALVYRLTLWFQRVNLNCFYIIVLKHSAFIYKYTYVCMFECVYIYIYIHALIAFKIQHQTKANNERLKNC